MKNFILEGDHPLDFRNLHYSKTSVESKWINNDTAPKVIISASGMCDAGRIRHHLKHNLWNAKNAIVFVGYQAAGSLGRILLDGAKEVKLFGETIAVNAKMYNLGGFSAHADRDSLYDWLDHFREKPREIFLVHGEMDAKRDFAAYVQEHKGWPCVVVDGYNEYEMSGDEFVLTGHAPETEFAAEHDIDELSSRLSGASANLNEVLANAKLALNSGLLEAERLAEIQNMVVALEKSVINLGASVSD